MGVGARARRQSFAFKGAIPGLVGRTLKKCVSGKVYVLNYGAIKRRGTAQVAGDSKLRCQLCPSAERRK